VRPLFKSADQSLFETVPHLSLGRFPTPVIRLSLPGYPAFWVKDDGRTGTPYGGNKVRKFEYLLAEARQRGKGTLIVGGDTESHTVRACAKLGRGSGFRVEAVVYPHGRPTGSARALAELSATGARVILARSFLETLIVARLRALLTGGMLVPLGGSSPLSTVGYIRAAFELHRQVLAHELPAPDRIYVAFASGGTTAGLLIGLALAGSTAQVVAVQTVESAIANGRNLRRLVRLTLRRIARPDIGLDTVMSRLARIDGSCLGSGYRDVPGSALEAMRALSGTPLSVETVFTAKALAVMLNDLSRDPSGAALFWNTHDQGGSAGADSAGAPKPG
jgi:D-cysteine desulfhydrase